MSAYTIKLHDQDGQTSDEWTVSLGNDNDAINHARSLNHLNAIELWQGARLVAQFAPLAPLGPKLKLVAQGGKQLSLSFLYDEAIALLRKLATTDPEARAGLKELGFDEEP